MFVQFEMFVKAAQGFIFGQPILFVLASGFVVAVSSVIVEIIIYWAARLGGRPLAQRVMLWFRMDTRNMDRTENMFLRWGVGLVMFGRILPGVRALVSVPAGITRMNFGLFLGAALSGAYVWNTLLVGISYLLGFKLTLFGLSFM